MDPVLYKAAMEGNIDDLRQNKDKLDIQSTPNNNTILHVAAQFRDIREFAKEILKMEPSLLCRVNSKGETAIHIASRKGRSNTVKELIGCAKTREDPESRVRITKDMLRMMNKDKDTALHEAVRNNRLNVAELLIQEDPEFSHAASNSEETPLYLAAERNYCKIVVTIVENCKSAAYSGPNGRTALHAAVISGCVECMKNLMDRKPNLTKEADSYGWTPLHYAARLNFVLCARKLLDVDKSMVYLTADKDDNKTALHLAASQGHVDIMKELLSKCPDCWEMVNSRGQNILHIAVEYEKDEVIEFILGNSWFSNLVNQKDDDGNTSLHLFAASDCLTFTITDLIRDQEADKGAFNKKNLIPFDVAKSTDRYRLNEDHIIGELEKVTAPYGRRNLVCEDNDWVTEWKKAREQHKKYIPEKDDKFSENNILVAALIATVTFAAGFTLPGGYDGNDGPDKGMAVLVRKAAFKAFVISNTTAVIFSLSALFAFLVASFYPKRTKVIHRQTVGLCLMLIALGAMMVAFITGTYAVLANSSGLAIAVCVVGSLSFLVYYILLHKLVLDYS